MSLSKNPQTRLKQLKASLNTAPTNQKDGIRGSIADLERMLKQNVMPAGLKESLLTKFIKFLTGK